MNETWNEFFGNPIIGAILEEAEQQQEQPQENTQEESDGGKASDDEINKLAGDLKSGHLSQDDLIDMYKSGKLSQADIKKIVDQVEGGEGGDEGEEQPMDAEPATEEELLAQQIEQTNDLFVKFALYDKIIELTEKLDYFKNNFEDIRSDIYQRVLQLREFLNVLSNLVFNLETAVAYQMYGSLLLQLTDLFKEYNNKIKPRKEAEEKAQKAKQDLIDQNDIAVTPEEKWAEQNKSDLLEPDQNNKWKDNEKYKG